MSDPRNVTPPDELSSMPSHSIDEEFRARYYEERSQEPEWMAWKWASSGRSFPWLGVLLVLIGGALLVQYFVPEIGLGTLILLAFGLAFLAAFVLGRSWFAMVPGVLLVALAVARLGEDLNIVGGPGLTSLSLAVGFLVIWLLAYARGRRWNAALWAAGIFGLIGAVQASWQMTGLADFGALWPIVIIAVGLFLLYGARRR
jgi:hypothetical protein